MKIDHKQLLRLMEYIEASDVSGASFDDAAERRAVMYPSSQQQTETTKDKVGLSISERDYYLSLLRNDQLVSGNFTKNGILNLKLTLDGHAYLKELRDQKIAKVALKWLARQFDKIFSSIVLPVLVAILTVFVMRYLNLTQ